jgi:phosphate transport system substrate-binding protein
MTGFSKTMALAAVSFVAIAGAAEARDQIRVVGSSTVFPFSSTVAENFGKTSSFKTPIVESTGTGGGMKLFCAGVGVEHPDFTGASRRMKKSEFDDCAKNGVNITEIKIGFDGIVVANSKASATYSLTKEQIWLALAKEVVVDGKAVANPNMTWNQIDPSLPSTKIEVLGPPPTSGTRDAFVELVMEEGCQEAMKTLNEDACAAIREDGGFVEAGENDNLIVQKLEANPIALGIFGFSFLDQNSDKLQGSLINGVVPTFENIASGEYGVSRSMFLYAKQQHVGVIPGMKEFIAEMVSEGSWGPDGYLVDKGLIPLPEAERASSAASANGLAPLSM